MTKHDAVRELAPDRLGSVRGAECTLGIYKPGFRYRKESLRFFRACVGDDVYSKAMNSEAGKAHHYAVARAFLDQPDWEKFVWIEEHGSLDSFPG